MGTLIMGTALATVEQMRSYIRRVNPQVPQKVIDMLPFYLSEGQAEGVRGDIAFAQSCIETGNFGFKGSAVTLDQNNFAGIGVTSNGMKGNSWATPQLGIRAQIQHLKAYGSNDPLSQACVDPRFKYVPRASAVYVEWLGIQENPQGAGWAAGRNYGDKILSVLDLVLKEEGGTGLNINKLISAYNHNSGNINRIKYIVIHYVGAVGGAKANCQYFAGGDRGASAHYFVDYNGDIWQSVEDANIAWHCGTKSGYKHPNCRNANSIGIELCVRNKGSQADTSKDWYFDDATVWAAAELTKHLMQKYNVPADHVLRHYDVTGKICPNPYVYNTTKHTWTEFKSLISSAGRNYMQVGDSGEEVKQLQKDLNTLGYDCGTADGIYGEKTAAAVEKLQKATGLAADGMAGIKTLAKIDELLNAKPQWIQQGGRWWYRHADGSYTKSGWEKIGGTWYYFDAAGWMKTGWVLLGDKWYYLKSSGAMASDEIVKLGKETFYLTPEGHMATTNSRGALV